MIARSHRSARAACRSLLAALACAVCGAAVAQPAWQEPVLLAEGKGVRGPWQQNESRYHYVDDPAVALDAGGNAAVAWVEQARKDVLFQRVKADGSKHPAQPVNVSRSPATFSWLPRVVLVPDAQDTVYLLWQEIIFSGGSHGGDMLFARSDDGGASFSEPLNISRSVGGDGKGRINKDVWHNGSYDIVAGPDGALYAAWTEYDGALWFSRSQDGGRSFSSPRRVDDGRHPARAPALALGPGSRLYLAWTVGEDDGADIRVARSDDGGNSFAAPLLVAPGKSYSDAPRIAVEGSGILHLAFAESTGGPFDRYRILHARSADGARSFEAPRELSAATYPESAAYPALAIDSSNGVHVLWEHYPDFRKRPRGLGMAISSDGGASFGAPMQVPASVGPDGGDNGSYQGLLMDKLAVNEEGALAVVNSSLRDGKRSRVWLLRASPSR